MAHSPKTLLVASGLATLLAIASVQANAQGNRGTLERDVQRSAAVEVVEEDVLPGEMSGIQAFFDNLMKSILQSYRTTLKTKLEDNETVRTVVKEKRVEQRNQAIAESLRASPELIRPAISPKVPNTVPQARTPELVAQAPVQPAPQERPVVEPPQQSAPAREIPQVASNTPPVVTAPTPAPEPAPTPVVGNARLSWSIPTQRENGDPLALNEIASYEIYVTAENAGTSRTIRVDNRNQTQFTLQQLEEDTYYFSMVTIDTEGMYSELSQVVSKTIQ